VLDACSLRLGACGLVLVALEPEPGSGSAACSLSLAACSLMLAACSFRSSA